MLLQPSHIVVHLTPAERSIQSLQESVSAFNAAAAAQRIIQRELEEEIARLRHLLVHWRLRYAKCSARTVNSNAFSKKKYLVGNQTYYNLNDTA